MARVKYTSKSPGGTVRTIRFAPNLSRNMSQAARNSPAIRGPIATRVQSLLATPYKAKVAQNMLLAAVDSLPPTPETSPRSLLSSSFVQHVENLPASHGTQTPTSHLNQLPVPTPPNAALFGKKSSKTVSRSIPPERSPPARRIRKLTKRGEESKQQELQQHGRRRATKKGPSALSVEKEQANGDTDSAATLTSETSDTGSSTDILARDRASSTTPIDLLCVVAAAELDTINHTPPPPLPKHVEQKPPPALSKRLQPLREYKELTEMFCPLIICNVPAEVDLTDPVRVRIWSTSPEAQILMLSRFQQIEVESRMNARFVGTEKLTMKGDWHRLDYEQRQRILDFSVAKSRKLKSKAGKKKY